MYLNIAKKLAWYFKISTEILKMEMGGDDLFIGKHKKKRRGFILAFFGL
jgi:hypothetical protein